MTMDPRRWRRVCDVFQATLGHDAGQRAGFLAGESLGDEEIRQAVEELLRAHDSAGDFLEVPAAVSLLGPFHARTEFTGTERFDVVRSLGEGGMGIVYAVHDRARDQIVALKTLLHARPADVYHLKREFRSLADVAHRNLVSLYELVVEGPHCFFTMELVNGVNLVRYVRGGPEAAAPLRVDALRDVFGQLTEGLSALHRHGKLHRDIKPSNVLVTPEGRVVILDFGLIADVVPEQGGGGDRLAGTPAYISPEDISGVRATESSDWYSVGITLYQALTGRVPFEGRFDEQLRRKNEGEAPPPSRIAPGVPDDLSAICMDLISRDLDRRLSGRDALRGLAPRHSRDGRSGDAAGEASAEPPFVGRVRPLAVLNGEFLALSQGRPASVYIHGPSGIGKSALIRRFLDQLPASDEVVVLRGRCYEQESVPYKALDGVIDSLSRYLGALPRAQARALMPRDVLALSRLFPVMLQVEAVAASPPEHEVPDPFVLRRRAFTALRELLTAIADRHPLVFYIDDLHWADADSAVLLEELLRPPSSPRLLMLLCFRSEETASKPFLQALLERSGSDGCVSLSLGPMEDDEAHELIGSLVPSESPVRPIDRLRIAREAGGNPFFLEQLTRYVAVNDARSDQPATFVDMLGARLRSLPEAARLFLDTLAVCGRPMAPQLVHEACGLSGDDRPLVASLRSAHFLRSSGSAERVVLYHDRIRQTLAALVSPDAACRIHRAMAQTLVARRAGDAEALFEHYSGAGDRDQASTQAALAAKKAGAALAFDRAGSFYRRALELTPASPDALDWKKGLATALANAGRPADAAEVYLDASASAGPAERLELQRRAAEQFLTGGHIDRGLDVIRTVLAAVRMRLMPGPRAALASLLFRRARLRWRGLDFVERSEDRVSADDLLRIDTCWSVVTGLALVDIIRAAAFQTRHLMLALDAGEPYRVARALSIEALFRASGNGPRRQGSARFAAQAKIMSETVGHPHAVALSTLTSGMGALLVGEWRTATTLCGRALEILRDTGVGTTWEVNLAQNFFLGSLLFRGELRDVAGRLPDLLTAAQERGNLYFETELRTRMNLVWLAANEPDEGERQANEAMEQWSHEGFHRQHYNHMLARIQTELYRGRAEAAWRLIDENWAAMDRTFLFRIQFLRIEASYLRARCALLMVGAGGDPRRFLSVARRDARRIAAEKMAWSDPVSWLLQAAVACGEGRPDLAPDHLARAAAGFDRAEMQLYAAVTRRRLGALLKGDRGRELVRQADEWMAAQEVRNPALLTRMLAPGFPDQATIM
jgi:tetratricopeptide (TPR) repeat protein